MKNYLKKFKSIPKEKKVLIGAIAVATAVIGGSTFAWFSSTDEVTNKLSASGEYGVSITEDFTPEMNWIPGQSIKKEVAALNTGNVDAFVRMWLTGTMRVVTEIPGGTTINDFKKLTLEGSSLGGKFSMRDANNNTNYYRALDEKEALVMQTGELVYAEGAFEYIENKSGASKAFASYTDGGGAPKLVDSDSFKPKETGLYIFRRNYSGDKQYSGYYCVKDSGGDIKYYALVDRSVTNTGEGGGQDKNVYIDGLGNLEGTALITAITNGTTIKVRKATESVINKDGITWEYKIVPTGESTPFAAGTHYLVASIKNPVANTNQDSIKINVELDNIGDGTDADKWQIISDANKNYTFYYTNDLQSGTESKLLIKNVNLDTSLKEGAYVQFDFDLDVNLDSIQIVKTDSNMENTDSIKTGWDVTAGISATAATPAATNDGNEISVIKWTKK